MTEPNLIGGMPRWSLSVSILYVIAVLGALVGLAAVSQIDFGNIKLALFSSDGATPIETQAEATQAPAVLGARNDDAEQIVNSFPSATIDTSNTNPFAE